ncbi:MAG: SIMPL domain-containing protein [Planctomycetota bacterium]
MDHHVRINFVSSAAVIASAVVLSVVASTAVASRAYVKRGEVAAEGAKQISVKGYARTRVISDLAQWSITVKGRGQTLEQAYAELEAGVDRVTDFLTASGFDRDDLARSAIETSTRYQRDAKGNTTNDVAGYTLTRTIGVTTRDVNRIAEAAGEVTALLREGITVISGRPAYYFTGIEPLKIRLAGEASANGRERAEAIAAETGSRVASVSHARMGVIQITEPDSTEVSSYGIYDTDTIQKDVAIVVTLTLELDEQ